MNIIHNTDLSHEGNDCYISKAIAVIEYCSLYAVIQCTDVTGWSDYADFSVVLTTRWREEAIQKYTELGGKL